MRDKNKGTRRGVGIYWMGYARMYVRIKIEKEKEILGREKKRIPREMVEREITGKGQTVVTK